MSDAPQDKQTFTERMDVASHQLVGKVRELVQDGNAKRVVIKDQDGKELLTVPLTMGVAAGGVLTLAAPMLAAIGAVAALVTKVQLEVVREGTPGEAAASGSDEPGAGQPDVTPLGDGS